MFETASLILSYPGPEPDTELMDWIADGHVGGVVLFAHNFRSVAQLTDSIARMQTAALQPLHIMIDEEGGRVRRLPPSISPMPSLTTYGSAGNVTGAAADYAVVSEMLSRMGINTLLAPVLDVRTDDNTWMADRTFSADPAQVVYFAARAVAAIQRTGLAACAKHFPGLAGVRSDLHHHKFIVGDSAREIEARDLPPFRAAINAGVKMVMVSHAVYTSFDTVRPAVFSPIIINDILRTRLGFDGMVLSDDLAMRAIAGTLPIEKAIELAARAGCDEILICNDRTLQRRAVQFLSQQGGVR